MNKLSKDDVLEKYIQLSKELQKVPSKADIKRCSYLPSPHHILELFGTMENLHKLSGLDNQYKNMKATTFEEKKEEIAKRYLKLCDEVGRLAKIKDINECKYLIHNTNIKCYFGSIKELQNISGAIDKYGVIRGDTEEEIKENIIRDYIRLSNELGRLAIRKDLKNCNYICSYDILIKYFETITNLKRLVAEKFNDELAKEIKKDIIVSYVYLSKKIGKAATVVDLKENEFKYKYSEVRKYFGTIDNLKYVSEIYNVVPYKARYKKSYSEEEKHQIEQRLIKLRIYRGRRLDRYDLMRYPEIPPIPRLKELYSNKTLGEIWEIIESKINPNIFL